MKMKKNFTKLVCLAAASLCVLSVVGQERATFSQEEIILRKDENKMPEVLPDSIITFSASGEKVSKTTLSTEYEGWYEIYTWDKNGWVNDDGHMYIQPDQLWFNIVDDHYCLHLPKIGNSDNMYRYVESWSGGIRPVNVSYNADGQVNEIEIIHIDDWNKGQIWLTYKFIYNERGQLVSHISYNHDYPDDDERNEQYDYYYNEHGDLILYEDYRWLYGEKMIYDYSVRQIAKYDSQGKRIRIERYAGNTNLQRFLLDEYDIYYYSDETYTPNIAPENTTPRRQQSGQL